LGKERPARFVAGEEKNLEQGKNSKPWGGNTRGRFEQNLHRSHRGEMEEKKRNARGKKPGGDVGRG